MMNALIGTLNILTFVMIVGTHPIVGVINLIFGVLNFWVIYNKKENKCQQI